VKSFANIVRNTQTLLVRRDIRRGYLQWLGCGGIWGRAALSCPGGGRLENFHSFSEWLSMKIAIPGTEELNLMRRVCTAGGHAMDIGANIGLYTVILARIQLGMTITAFEASPRTCQRLRANVAMNHLGNARVAFAAVSDKAGEVWFLDNQSSSPTNRILDTAASEHCARVPAVSLDEYCENQEIAGLCFAKIDVEGAETRVLRGAGRLLRGGKIACILIEICPANLERLGSCIGELYEVASEVGYRFFEVGSDGRAGRALSEGDLNKIALANVLLLSDR